MVFIIDFVEAAVDIVVTVVEIILQIVEVIIEFIMTLLGFTDDQTIEYFEVHNIPLFDNTDNKNPLVNLIVRSVLKQEDLAGNLIYGTTFRSLKGDLRKFMAYIDDGNYFEGFPAMESYISYPDYTELTDVLTTLNGAPCTPELSYTQALTQTNWVQSYLQENNTYDVGANDLGAGEETTSTTPASTSSSSEIDHYNFRLSVDSEVATEDSVTVNAETPVTTSPASTSHDNSLGTDFFLNINDEVATSDNVIANMIWHVDFGDITYNSGPDNYTVGIYNDEGSTTTVTIPSKPTQLHYVSYYYIDSAPSRQYIFIYKVGIGTYPTLDDPQNEINLDATVLEAVPAIPLRIANVDYTTLAPAKVAQIDELC